MRILFVTEEPIRFSGKMVRGGQIHIKTVIMGLRERGHDVHLVDWNSDPDTRFQHSITPQCRFIDGAMRTFQKVRRMAKSIDPDVIISKTRKVYLAGLAAARTLGIPHVAHVGSSLDPPTSSLIERLDKSSFAARLRAPHDAYFIVCSSIGDELQRRGIDSEQIYDVRNAVDTERFVPEPDVELPETTAERLRDTEKPLLGFVGGITDYKGVFDLAEAVVRSSETPNVVVAGDGPARDRFERALNSHGIFLGSVSYEQMPAIYAAIDALMLPSHTEGLPRVVLEAAAAGKPTVATNVGGIPDVIIDGETGLLCPPKRPTRFAAAIDELFTERDPIEMGRRARERIVNEYTWEAQYDRYESFLTDVVSR